MVFCNGVSVSDVATVFDINVKLQQIGGLSLNCVIYDWIGD